jgi:hypothetical protein
MSKNFKPNSKIVRVTHKFGIRFYAVRNVAAYISKCVKDGKEAFYMGVTDNEGNLIK